MFNHQGNPDAPMARLWLHRALQLTLTGFTLSSLLTVAKIWLNLQMKNSLKNEYCQMLRQSDLLTVSTKKGDPVFADKGNDGYTWTRLCNTSHVKLVLFDF